MEEPSKVIHVRNVASDITVGDLVQLLKPFGAVAKTKMLRRSNQAFLQMEDTEASASAVEHYRRVQANIKGRNVYFEFSPYNELTENDQDTHPSRILVVSVYNMTYPITIEVLHQVFSAKGFVEKIVVFQKSAGFQALVQYQSKESAIEAKDKLHERNIYEGCCNLDIRFSKRTELEVKYNNDISRDFTNPLLPADKKCRTSQVGYGDPGSFYGIQPGAGVAFAQMGNEAAVAAAFGDGEGLLPGITGTNHRCTILAANLEPDKIDANKLFNLFSLYGNIIRIHILHDKPDRAFIQMADGFQAELAVYFLKEAILFGKPLDVACSRFKHIKPSPYTHEFAGSNLNRFNSKTVCAPTKMIHVSSLPQDITQDKVLAHLEGFGTVVYSLLFQVDEKKQALIMFENEAQAIDTLVCKHGTTIGQSTICLSFSLQ